MPIDAKRITHSRVQKRFIAIVILAAAAILVISVVLNIWNIARMRSIVSDQFSNEQLTVARSISRSIESEIRRLTKELLILREKIANSPREYSDQWENINLAFQHVIESGVHKIEVIDFNVQKTYAYLPRGTLSVSAGTTISTLNHIDMEEVMVFGPEGISSRRHLLLVASLGDDGPAAVVFHVNISWFLSPLMNIVRSGKTGYSWIIDDKGYFVYHPVADFIGKNAFTIRKEKRADISYEEINFIQKEKMMKGGEGTGRYMTGWHRGHVGEVKKLIAYSPIILSAGGSQLWSVAVAAPVSEIEDVILGAIILQFLILGLVVVVVLFFATAVSLFEIRWSRILETKVAERTEALKRSEDKYRTLVESAEDFIYTLDSEGKFLSMNNYTAGFFGGSAASFVGKRLSSIFPDNPEDRQFEMVNFVFEHGKSVRNEFDLKIAGHSVWLSTSYMPLRDVTGKVNGVLCIARDITENKMLERRLIETEKLASLGMLAAGIAHEINNPIGIILGFCDLLLRGTPKDTQAHEDLKTIERQALHCEEVVKNLLNISRVERETSTNCDLFFCLQDIIKAVKHTLDLKNVALTATLDDELPEVRADCRQLQQVFLNLINNAVSAMPDGGNLRITAAADKSAKDAVVVIEDDGCGIKESDLEHIFEPFFTTKAEREGTGLGLFVSYGIIKKYGGTIECQSSTGESNKERGTTFRIRIPFNER